MYFVGLRTVGEVKSAYRTLAKANHPDLGGDTAMMQDINAQYHSKLEALDGQEFVGTDEKVHTYHYEHDIEQEVMDKVLELLGLQLPGVEVEVIGTWVWAYGDPDPGATKPVKELLKGAGLIWHSKRKRWYWRRFAYRRTFSGMDFDDMRRMYGNTKFPREEEEKRAALVAA